MPNSLFRQIEACFPGDLSRDALIIPGQDAWSFRGLSDIVARTHAALALLGLEEGDRIAVIAEKSPQVLALYLAALRGGFVFLPMNTAYRRDEVAYILGNAEPSLIVCGPERLAEISETAASLDLPTPLTLDAEGRGSFAMAVPAAAEQIPPVADMEEEALAVILYTSGTTGKPKGAMLSHGNLASNGLALREAWGFTSEDVLLHALPIFHAHGLFVACHCALLSGAPMIWLQKFEAETVCDLLPEATVFMGVPTYYTRLLASERLGKATAANMRLFTSGSAPLLVETFSAFRTRTGHTILERYGMTETGMNTSNPYEGERRPGTVGFPLPGVSVRIVGEDDGALAAGETGDLQVKGPNVFSGYWRLPEKTAEEFTEDGWFRTGDVARIDAEGYVHLVGRSKDMIISGGFNVYPKEIETLIDDMPEVDESALVGVWHADFGEAGVAVVVLRKGAALGEDELIGRLKGELANYKVPKRAFFVGDLPRNTMGKVQKNLLRETYKDACKAS